MIKDLKPVPLMIGIVLKSIALLIAFWMVPCFAAMAQTQSRSQLQDVDVKVLKPSGNYLVPDLSASECEKLWMDADEGRISWEEYEKRDNELSKIPFYRLFYTPLCSWYCGGTISAQRASSTLPVQGKIAYGVKNLHDFNHETVWAEGVDGYGVGEYVVFFAPEDCPRITTVNIINGYVKTEALWRANSRVKKLMMYFNDVPYAVLELEDSRSVQWFDIGIIGYGPQESKRPSYTLKFEILEVYPGEKFQDTVISDIYFDGVDVH